MARAALQFLDNFASRCDGVNNGTVQPLMADASTRASLITLLQTSAQLALGVNNTLANYATNYADPLAKRLAALYSAAYNEWAAEFGAFIELHEPEADVTEEQLLRVHTAAHLQHHVQPGPVPAEDRLEDAHQPVSGGPGHD